MSGVTFMSDEGGASVRLTPRPCPSSCSTSWYLCFSFNLSRFYLFRWRASITATEKPTEVMMSRLAAGLTFAIVIAAGLSAAAQRTVGAGAGPRFEISFPARRTPARSPAACS